MQLGSRDDRNDFEWTIPDSSLTKRFPGAATFIAQVEWAWDLHLVRLDAYYISSNRRRSHWFLWLRYTHNDAGEFRMMSLLYACCPRRTMDRKTVAIQLLLYARRYNSAESERSRFDWTNDTGLLGVSEVHTIAKAVWCERGTGNE
jgi:hypothetical protein